MIQKKTESRKDEIRFTTSDPARMLGKWVARRAVKTWTEECRDADTGEIMEVQHTEPLLERGTYIAQDTLASIRFMLSDGSLTEVEVTNQNRQGTLLENSTMLPFKAVARIDGRKKTFILYATSAANALLILVDYIELNFKGGFEITKIEEMDYCVVLIDRLKPAEARRYGLDTAYLKGEIPMESFVEATCDRIADGNPDATEEEPADSGRKFYQIVAHIVRSNDKEGSHEEDGTFIVHTVSAVRANMLIEKYLRDNQEERYRESLSHPERTFVRYDIRSYIEESKIMPIGYFVPRAFSEVYNDTDDDR